MGRFQVNSRAIFGGLASAAGLMALASSAQAALSFDANLIDPPGVYYGTGNSNGHFTVDTGPNIELGVRAHVYQQNATAPTGDLYVFALGQSISVDFSANAFGLTSLDGFNALLTITDLANNNTQSFDPQLIPDNAHTAPNDFQNSERLKFGFMDQFYNMNQNNTFDVILALGQLDGPGQSVSMVIQQGAGFSAAVPEPASWALLIMGFGGIGASLRRARKMAGASAA